MFGTYDGNNTHKGTAGLEEYNQNVLVAMNRLKENGIETVVMTLGMLCLCSAKGFAGFRRFAHLFLCLFKEKQESGRL